MAFEMRDVDVKCAVWRVGFWQLWVARCVGSLGFVDLERCKVALVLGLGVGGYFRKDRTAKGIIMKE
jgi:hypothetical protein